MNILMFSNLYPPAVSGSSTFTYQIAQELQKRRNQIIVVTAKLSREDKDFEIVDGVHVYRLNSFKLPKMGLWFNFKWMSYTFTLGNVKKIFEIVEIYNPSIINLHNHMFDLALSAVLVKVRYKIPLVITIHTIIKHINKKYDFILSLIDRLLLKNLIISYSDALISPDINVYEYVKNVYNGKLSIVIPYGIKEFKKPSDELIKNLTLRYNLSEKKIILSLGHIHEIRNRVDLINAIPLVIEKYPETILIIVGMISTDITLNLINKLGLSNRVIFTGALPHTEAMALLYLSDIEVHWLNQDSSEKTSLGIASLEAMSAGKVIITSANLNTYGIGILVDMENLINAERDNPTLLSTKIIKILDDGLKRRAIEKNAKDTINRHFSWDIVCDKTIEAYNTCISENQKFKNH